MELFRVNGGTRLVGEVAVSGAKNSVLKLMAASLLVEGRTVLTNVPRILDVTIMSEVLRRLGCEVALDGATLTIDVPAEPGTETDYDLVRRMRASINVLGPLLARRGEVRVAHPGGDAIGSRGLDYHIAGLVRMGAEITNEHGFVIARADRLHGAPIWLDFPSVGATENLLMAAVLAKGTTVIDNAAREPDIVDICNMLTAMGARVAGAGTSSLQIEGVDELRPVEHRVIPDRIVSGTWAFAAAITRGDVTVRGAEAAHLEIALDKLTQCGARVDVLDPTAGGIAAGDTAAGDTAAGDTADTDTAAAVGGFRVRMDGRPKAVDVVTLPYPGF
ncbi:MAG TPA: UDP-N-acetylglucosamine 1-carboxyvinyltransferase, partial [Cryptosporangiaceae bacterium]|nr:UDP-N-acetylglucosamine 1-carboxyvinyltransferase [Cryptosporangiaceae bacterium]